MSLDLREIQKLNSSIQLLLTAHNRFDEVDHSDAIQYLFERQNVLLNVSSPVISKESSFDIQSRVKDPDPSRPPAWMPVPGQPHYEVSDTGFLRWKKVSLYSKRRDYPVTQSTMFRWKEQDYFPSPRPRWNGDKHPYSVVKLYRSGRHGSESWYFVDVLVLEAFVSKRPHDTMPIHKNGNTLDNSLTNLKWSPLPAPAPEQNKRKGNQKLSDAEVSEIKLQLRQGVQAALIARMYNVTVTTIYAIKKGTSRGHIE